MTHQCLATLTRIQSPPRPAQERKSRGAVTVFTIIMIPIIIPVALAVVVGAGVYSTAQKGAKAAKRRFSKTVKQPESASSEQPAGKLARIHTIG